MSKEDTIILTPNEAQKRILSSGHLCNVTIKGVLCLDNKVIKKLYGVHIKNNVIEGGLTFRGTMIGGRRDKKVIGDLDLEDTTILGDLDLCSSIIFRDLSLRNVTIEGSLNLLGTVIKRYIDFSTKKGPLRIYVNPRMAQRVHLAAPIIPLVLIRERD